MKLLAHTTGAFQLLVEDTGELVKADGLSVVRPSPWLGERISKNEVIVLEKVGDNATQADWDDAIKQADGDQDLAVAAFVSEFPVDGKSNVELPVILGAAKVVGPDPANPSGQTAGLSPDEKPGDVGEEEGPGGPKDTNKPKPAAQRK